MRLNYLLDFCELTGSEAGMLARHFGTAPWRHRGDARFVFPAHAAPRYLFLLDLLGYQDIDGANYKAVREPDAHVQVWADPFVCHIVQGGEAYGHAPCAEVAVVRYQADGNYRFVTEYFVLAGLLSERKLTAPHLTRAQIESVLDTLRTKSERGLRSGADLSALDFERA